MTTPTIEEVQKKYKPQERPDAQATFPFSMSIEGLEGTGKTHFSLLTCPTPIVHINCGDRDAGMFLYDMSDERYKQTTPYPFYPSTPSGWTREEGEKCVLAISEIARAHMSDGKLAGGTFILDSGSSWWELMQEVYVAPEEEKAVAAALAKGKDFRKSGGLIYGKANLIVSGVLTWLKNQGAFVVITHQKKQAWDKDGPVPGKFEPKINSKVPYIVEARIDLRKACAKCGAPDCQATGHSGRKYYGKLIKLGHNGSALEGTELENMDFNTVYSLFTGRAYGEKERLK